MNNATLLVVDDESMNLRLYQEMLKPNNFRIITANNGQEALDKAEEFLPDVVLMDWNMPVMDGMESLKQLKINRLTKDIPVIMITGVMNSSENLNAAMEAGAIDFLRKPFDKLELNARVKNILLLSRTVINLKEQYQSTENRNIFITSLISSIPHPLVYYSVDGIMLKCNELFEKLMEADKDEILGKSVYRYFDSEYAGLHLQQDLELIRNRTILSYERIVLSKGRTFIFTKNLITEKENIPAGIILILTDITELRKANENLLEVKKRELASSTMHLMHVSEMNNSLINDLVKISNYANPEGEALIRQVINKYRTDVTKKILNDFEKKFEGIFDSFYRVLFNLYPDLTPNERKLVAFLRLDLSTKDIAALTFQNPQSIDVARYRLRKKLKLKPDESFIDFLLKIEQ